MTAMKAVRIHTYGGADVLTYEDAPVPGVGQGEVLIRVAAASINPFDCAARSGYLASYFQYTFPHILGLDVAGEIVEVGPGVEGLSIGESVYGRSNPAKNGAYAEYISLPADQVAPIPRNLDLVTAASVPHAAVTAWTALVDMANLGPGQTVLIHAAAGGVGTFAVQLARWRGARVIGTCSANHMDYLRQIGADEVIDYNKIRFETVAKNVDVVLDLVGDMSDGTLQRSWQTLKPDGMLLSTIQYIAPEEAGGHGVKGSLVAANSCTASFLQEVGAMIENDQIRPVVSNVYTLDQIRQAHEEIEDRHTRGKIVIQMI